jgi:two-component system, NarL family, sensor kinase
MQHLLHKSILLILFCGKLMASNAQSANDSMLFEKTKTRALDLTIKNIDSAEIYADQLIKWGKDFKSDFFLAEALSIKAHCFLNRGKPDQAMEINQESYAINKKIKNDKGLASNHYRFGTIYNVKSDFVNATDNFLKSVAFCEKERLYVLLQKNYRKLSVLNISHKKYNESLNYMQKAMEAEKKDSADPLNHAENLLGIATCYKYLEKFEESEKNFNEAFAIYKAADYKFKMADVLCEMAALYDEKDLIKSIKISLEAQQIFDAVAPETITSINNMGNLGEKLFNVAANDSLIQKFDAVEIKKNKNGILEAAERYLTKAIALSKKQSIAQAILYYSGVLADLQAFAGDYKNAFANLTYKIKYNDSLYSQENKNAIAKLESEKSIIQLEAVNKQKSILNRILIGTTVGISLLGIIGYRNFQHRKKLQQQKIAELEKDKQLLAIDAMLKGQEEERSRIAKDLHDGLGGLLSGTKLSFINMKENLILTPENAIQFDKSLSMLDNTIADLRKVAHNLMPEALVKFGLQEAVRDFCNSIQSSTNLKVVYQQLGENRKLSNTVEVFTYRIIQELVNNAVKHAAAKQIIVQLTTNNNKVAIVVEDDGKGFDLNAIANNKGAGMENIKYRVQYLNGTIDTVTSAGDGTSVNIELMI